MRSKWIFIGLFLLSCILSGCETVKGAADGMKKDIDNLEPVDDWIQENLW